MRALASYTIFISAINRLVGQVFSWLSLGIVLVCFTVVVERYLFSTSQIWMQDLYVWLSGAMFMALSAYALMRDEHVRVDIFYRRVSNRQKAWHDLFGVLTCLLPFCLLVWTYALPYVQRAWRLHEGSPQHRRHARLLHPEDLHPGLCGADRAAGPGHAVPQHPDAGRRDTLLPAHLRYQTHDHAHQEAA